MAALIPTYQIKNETDQNLSIKVNANERSTILPTKTSIISIQSKKFIEVERSRIDEEQIGNLRRKLMITVTPLVRTWEIPTPGGTTGS